MSLVHTNRVPKSKCKSWPFSFSNQVWPAEDRKSPSIYSQRNQRLLHVSPLSRFCDLKDINEYVAHIRVEVANKGDIGFNKARWQRFKFNDIKYLLIPLQGHGEEPNKPTFKLVLMLFYYCCNSNCTVRLPSREITLWIRCLVEHW